MSVIPELSIQSDASDPSATSLSRCKQKWTLETGLKISGACAPALMLMIESGPRR